PARNAAAAPAARPPRPVPAAAAPRVSEPTPPWEDAEAASWQDMADGWRGSENTVDAMDAVAQPLADAPRGGPGPRDAGRPARGPATPSRVLNIPVREQPPPSARTEQRVARVPAADVPPAELVPTPEGDFWFGLVESLCQSKSVTAMVRQLAIQSQLLARDEGLWHLRVESESLASAALRERMQAVLAEAGHAVRLQVEVGAVKDSPARRQALVRAEQLESARQRIMADPFVQAMVRDFDARVVPGSITALEQPPA
ncbi:MAG: DNA polymerase III subunit gamma/tau C-terminal domain-containing protein, partial [Comamonas sp.]